MKNTKKQTQLPIDAFLDYITAFDAQSFLAGIVPTEQVNENLLGDGFELRPIELLAEGGQFVLNNSAKYSNLYHYGVKVSDQIFRKGGMGGSFREGYCSLILYTQVDEHTDDKKLGFDYGTHVIINTEGKVVLSQKDKVDGYPSHVGGHIGRLKNTFYNLQTGAEIVTTNTTNTIEGASYLIFNHKYDWYNRSLPLGVYRIDKYTCTIEKIDEPSTR